MRRPRDIAEDALGQEATMIASTGEWIRGADNKGAILGGFAAAVAAGLFTDADHIALTIRAADAHGWAARATFFGATAILVIAVVLVLSVIWPRTTEPERPNRHAFPSVARRRIGGSADRPGASKAEAKVEAEILSMIAMRKFGLAKMATLALGASFALLVTWRIVVSTLTL